VSEEVEKVAWPEPLSATAGCELPSMTNCTFPEGVPPPGAFAVTVAVKVTLWPRIDGFRLDTTVVVVSALLTVWLVPDDILAAKHASLLYVAISVLEPAVKEVSEQLPEPEPSVPMQVFVPSLTVTLPVGVPRVLVTVKLTV
jgi:hypothetical protein